MIRECVLPLLLLVCSYLHATTEGGHVNTKGSDFHIVIGPNLFRTGAGINPQLLVTTSEPDPVTFWVAWDKKLPPNPASSNTTHTVSRGEVVSITVPLVLAINSGSPQTPDLGIRLQTQGGKEVTVIGVNEQQASTDAFLAFPKIETKSKTYEYFALSVARGPTTGTKSFFGLVTIEPQTTCTITTVVATRTGRLITNPRTGATFALAFGIAPRRDHTVTTSNEGTSIAGVPQSTGDMSGTRVVCDKPVSFITGHQCGLLPSGVTACDHMVEQVPPTETWGFKFFLVALSTRKEDGYRILASKAGTQCTLTCTDSSLSQTITLANPGSFVQRILADAFCCVECNRPVLIFQYSLGHSNDLVSRSDPFIVMIPPVGQYSNDYDLIFFESKELDTRGVAVVFESWINIAVPVEYDPSGLRFDGDPLSGVSFRDVTCSNGEVCGRVAQYKPTSRTGAHTLAHTDPNAKFIATVYGWERENTYGYIGGMNFDPIAAEVFCIVNPSPSASESDGNASFVVTRTGSATDRSCILYNVTDVSTQGLADYMSASGECCLEPNEKRKTCEVQLVTDSVGEEDEVLRIELNPKPGQCVCDPPNTRTDITIQDKQVEPCVFSLEKDRYDVNETDGKVWVGVVKKSGNIPSGESVTITVTPREGAGQVERADPATFDVDYSSAAHQVVFQPGDTIMYVHINITLDGIFENTEYFNVGMMITEGSGSVMEPTSSTVFIWEEGNTIAFEKATHNTSASDEFYEEVRLVASQPFARDTAVNISFADISATGGPDLNASGVDYGNEVYTVTFKAGSRFSTYASIPIAPDDDSCEGDEKFKSTFEVPDGYRNLVKGDPEEAEITIQDVKDIIVDFDKIHCQVFESDGFAKCTLTSNCATSTEYSVVVSPENGNATAGEDYIIDLAPYTVTFAPGETTATVMIPIRNDTCPEQKESFDALLSIPEQAASLGVRTGSRDRSTVWIDDDDSLEVVLEPASYNVSEDDGLVCLILKANGTASCNFTVTVETSDGTATSGEDYDGGEFEVLFTAGTSEAQLKVNITDDAIPEPTETFTARLRSTSNLGVSVGSDDSATVSIIDDDEEITVEFEKIKYNVSESVGFAVLTLVSSSPSSTEYSVDITTQDGSARAGEDYDISGAPYTATFAPRETSATVVIPIINDSCPELRESFDALLSIPGLAASLGVRAGSRDMSIVWIDDDDCLEVVFDPTSYAVNEDNGIVCLTLKANDTASCNYSVLIDTLSGTATGGEDYTSGPYEVTFVAGSAEAELKVDITDDDIVEGAEEFTAKLRIPPSTSPKCIVVGPQDTATISIIDDEGIVVEFNQTEYPTSESDGQVTLTVVADKPASFEYTVTVTTADITASGGEDYSDGSYQVTFPAGETVARLKINITDDSVTECLETFEARLSLPNATQSKGISKGIMDVATVSISDNDATEISFQPIMYNASEADGNVNVILKSTKVFGFDCKLTVSTRNGTAVQGDDFEGLDMSMVILRKGSDSVVVMFTILNDSVFECPEDFFVDFSISEECSACGVSEGGDSTATVNIEDTDMVTVQFDPTMYREVEGDTTVDLVLTADKEIECTFDVRVDTEDGNATVAERDYTGTPSSGVVATFTPGSMSVTVPVGIRDDLVKEGDEYFVARVSQLDDPQDRVKIGPSDTANVTIEDNEGVIRVMFAPDAYTVDERDGMVTITLMSDAPIEENYTINVTTFDGSATSPDDYAGDTYEAFFEAGEKNAEIHVPINDDKVCGEMDEVFEAELSIPDASAAFGVVRGTPSVATVTIEDSDEVQVQFNPAMHTVEEIDGIVVIPIECGSCADSYNVSITCSDGTAESDSDYVASGTLEAVCEPGSNTSISVPIMNDATAEQTETFSCQIVDVPDGVTPGPNDMVIVRIVDDDSIVVNFNPVEYSTKEDDGMVTLTVVASAPSSEQYSVFVDTSDGVDPDCNATSLEDYTPGPYEVVFPPGVTEVPVTVGITPDNKCECDEKFTSQLRPPTSGNVSIGVNDTATITIVDDDEAQVQFNPAMHTVKESDGIVTIPIECGSCAEPYTVSITCSDGTAEANIDYVAGGTLEAVCKPGSNTSVLITLIEDILVEQMEMFTCQIVDPPEGVSPGPNDVVKIIIMDDEEIVVNFNPVEYSTKEDDGSVTLTVVASAPSSEQYSVFVDTSDGVDPDSSATSSEDYTPGPYEVVFPPGVTKVTVTINITRDDDCECDEEFTAQLLSPSGDVGIGVNDTASITIVDDDACRIMFCPDEDKTVDESVGSAEVCVCVEKNCIGEFQVCMNTTDGEDAGRRAVAGDDYESGPYCVDFAEGQNKSCVQIPIIDDDIHEPTQDFDVSIDVPDGLPLVPGKNITITITDDDPVICMIEEGSLVVLESDGTVTVGISINREIEEPVDCLISTSPVTALDNDDFEPFLEKRVTFEPQKGRSQMVSLQIIDDENPEPTENLRIEAKSGDLQIAGGNGTDPTTIPAINITIIDDDDRCQLTQNGIISTFFEEAMFVFNRSCPFEMVATCPQGGQDAIPFQIQIDLVNENTDSARVAIEFDKSTVVIGDDGRVTMLGNGEGIEVTQSSERVIVQVEALDVTVTRTLGEGGQVTVSTSNTSDLVQTNQLCGLCGNEKGMLIFKDGSPVPSEDPVEVSKFLEELSVSRSEQLFGDLRSECGGEAPQIRNDTIIGDPLYEVPLRLSKELTDQYGELSLCYEVHGRANSVFNLISDICVCVNAHYAPMIIPSNGNIINQIGVVAEDSTGQCQRIQVNLTECAASVNGVSVTSYNQNGISVIRRSGFKFPRVRISVPNCENIDLVMWVVCEERSGQPMIKFVVARGHNLTPTSHGLIGQFWNIDISAEKYTVTEEDRISPSDTHFAITVRPSSGSVRRFFADIHPETWDLENRHCLYAGSGQGGRTYEVPSLPDTVIEGRYSYYKTDDSDLFQCAYRYSRFESVCPSVPN